MEKIRNFIYLDDYKMYSISSQIFEGMTEYIIKTSTEKEQEKNAQKGPIFSGQVLADIIEKQKGETEKKFLLDYSYSLFENKLIENQKVLEISNLDIETKILNIQEYSFVKLSSRIVFNDTKLIEDTINHYNELGLALTYLTEGGSMIPSESELNSSLDYNKDRNQKSNKERALKESKINIKGLAAAKSLYLNEDYLRHLKFVINFGYASQFEVAIPISIQENHLLFSAILKREKLKENEMNIIKKYGRISEKEFTVFGIITQSKKTKEDIQLYRDRNLEGVSGMKEGIMNLIFHLANVESTFTGKLDYEYVIDPIAVYQEL